MDLEELRLFLAVAHHGAFNAAADSLNVSRTTLRRRVEALEARAGTALLDRSAQGILLTEAGKVLVDRGRILLESASALLDSIREVNEEPVGILRTVLPVGPPPHVLTELFAGVRAAYPKLRFHSRISHDPLSEPLTDIDVAIHFDTRPPPGQWVSEVLLEMPLRLVASDEYLSRNGTPRELGDLQRHELLVWQMPHEPWDRLPLVTGGHLPVEPVLVTSDAPALRHAAIRGVGLAYMPLLGIKDPLEIHRPLRPVMEDVVAGKCLIRVSVPEALAQIPKVRLVLDLARKYLAGATKR